MSVSSKHEKMLEEGERILQDQQQRQDTIDDFENLNAEDDFLRRLETGEEVKLPINDTIQIKKEKNNFEDKSTGYKVIEIGKRILQEQKELDEKIDDFENWENEDEHLRKLETGEEQITEPDLNKEVQDLIGEA